MVDKEAWTEVIEHPAVTCQEEPDPCLEDPTLPECPVVNPNCLDTPDAPGCEEPEEPPVVEEPPVIDEPVCPKVIASDEFEVDCGKGTPTKVSKNPPHAFTVVTCEGTFLVTIKGDNSLWEWVSDKSTGKRCKIEEGL